MTTYNSSLYLPIAQQVNEDYATELNDVHNCLQILASIGSSYHAIGEFSGVLAVEDEVVLVGYETTIYLPPASSNTGKSYTIKCTAEHITLTILPQSGEAIDNNPDGFDIIFPSSMTVISDGTAWWII